MLHTLQTDWAGLTAQLTPGGTAAAQSDHNGAIVVYADNDKMPLPAPLAPGSRVLAAWLAGKWHFVTYSPNAQEGS